MAAKWDNSPPQNLVILACALGSALLLFTLKFGFDAYYDGMRVRAVEERQTRYDDLEVVRERRAAWAGALASGRRMSIGAAMDQLAERGRGADPAIRPERPPEMNLGPLEGWNQLPQTVEVPPPPPVVEAAPPPSALTPEALQQLQQILQNLAPAPEGGAAPEGE